jgi:hypothetical protein
MLEEVGEENDAVADEQVIEPLVEEEEVLEEALEEVLVNEQPEAEALTGAGALEVLEEEPIDVL